MDGPDPDAVPMTFEAFRRSFHYGDHADMQFKFLANMPDEDAADTLARILEGLGEAFDTGDLSTAREAVRDAQVRPTPGTTPRPSGGRRSRQ